MVKSDSCRQGSCKPNTRNSCSKYLLFDEAMLEWTKSCVHPLQRNSSNVCYRGCWKEMLQTRKTYGDLKAPEQVDLPKVTIVAQYQTLNDQVVYYKHVCNRQADHQVHDTLVKDSLFQKNLGAAWTNNTEEDTEMCDPSTESTVIVEKGLQLHEEPEDGVHSLYLIRLIPSPQSGSTVRSPRSSFFIITNRLASEIWETAGNCD
ncbi:uncharacterized protein [Montipora foliosa]|uniref:uncharacterized protein n=1 Tax=Montipora foliosa TaxID=591990 RepID=UPI0035F1CAB8